jgi:hypothetical protein
LPKKVLQQIPYFSENQHDTSAIFSVFNFYIPLDTAAPRSNKCPRTWAGVVKTAWYGDVRNKQTAAAEFLVAAKQLVTNIHKRLNICAVTVLLITPVRLHELQGPRKIERSSVTRVALAGQQQMKMW